MLSEKENIYNIEIEKPPFLYHGSPNINIDVFEPRAETTRNKKEGPVIFSTPLESYSSMFLVPIDDSWVHCGYLNDIPYIVISDIERFQRLDNGGAIYKLPSNSFINPPSNMGIYEWISREKVIPIEKIKYKSALLAMIEKGVQVYFVTPIELNEFREKNYDYKILDNFKSENEKQGVNIIKFE